MSTRRLFLPDELESGRTLAITGPAARHAGTVLRLRKGDTLILFNGRGAEHEARIVDFARRNPVVEIGEALIPQDRPLLRVELGVALAKGASMDYTIQKGTELGACSICPLTSERTSVRLDGARAERKLAHWREIGASSCEQCGRHYLPDIRPVQSLLEWLEQRGDLLKVILDPNGSRTLSDLQPPPQGVALVSGPEGGFTDAELGAAAAAGFHPVRLGPRTLRAETAPIAALVLVQHLWGDM